ncbi:MAG TPA: diguanylate cyclase [Acidobacteriaceae bacterium]|nr:diguanylate cyclase [Acidobacteriaceae bacterium]
MTSSALTVPSILIATANATLHQNLAGYLTGHGYFIQTAENSIDAHRLLLADNPPDIALLDSSLPGQNSIELAVDVKRRRGEKQVWIIQLLPAQADPSTINLAAADPGIDDLLLYHGNAGPAQSDLCMRLGVANRVLGQIQRLEARVQAASLHSLRDTLTGLWNRESLLSLLFSETDRVQRMNTPLSFLLLDLDNFSQINRQCGHQAGDQILQEMARRLRRHMRSYDMLGRIGDDEFLIAMPGCKAHQARRLASRIRTVMLQAPFAAGEGRIKITVSIGLAQSRGRTPLIVLQEAEQALSAARREVRNCEQEFLPAAQDEAVLENQSA